MRTLRLLVVAVLACLPLLIASPAAAFPGEGIVPNIPCTAIPGPLAAACQAATHGSGVDPVNAAKTVAGPVQDVVSCATDPLGCVGKAMAKTAEALLGAAGDFYSITTGPDLLQPAFVGVYARIMVVGLLLAALRLIVVFAKAAVGGAPSAAGRAVLVEFPAAVAFAAYWPALLMILLGISEAMTQLMTFGTADQVGQWLHGLGNGFAKATFAGGAFSLIVMSALVIFGAVVLWLELQIQKAVVYAGALFGPVAATSFIGGPESQQRAHRYIGFLTAVVFAPPLAGAILALGAALVTTSDVNGVLAGLTLVFVAIFAVGMLFAWLPGQVGQIAQVASSRRQLAATGPAAAVPGPSQLIRSGVLTHSGGAASTAAAAGRNGGGGGGRSAWQDAGQPARSPSARSYADLAADPPTSPAAVRSGRSGGANPAWNRQQSRPPAASSRRPPT